MNVHSTLKAWFLCTVLFKGFLLCAEPDTSYVPAAMLYQNTWSEEYTIASGSLFNANTVYEVPLQTEGISDFVFPSLGKWEVISQYGWRGGRMHAGIDIKQKSNDTIVSAWDGKVRIAKYLHAGYGNVIIIRHENGLETVYAHLSKILTQAGSFVKAGEPIGLEGRTGRATTEHLHFEVRFLYKYFDPNILIDFKENAGTFIGDTLLVANSKFYLKRNYLPAPSLSEDSLINVALVADSLTIEHKDEAKKTNLSQPQSPSSSKTPNYHTVQKGDTLYSISRRYGISVDKLYKSNRMTEKSILYIGQKIKLK